MIFNDTDFADCGDGDWSRIYMRQPNPRGRISHVLIVRVWKESRRVRYYTLTGDINSVNIGCDWDHPDLTAIALGSDSADPVVDWLIENASTPEQLALTAELEKLIGGPR